MRAVIRLHPALFYTTHSDSWMARCQCIRKRFPCADTPFDLTPSAERFRDWYRCAGTQEPPLAPPKTPQPDPQHR